MPIGSKRWLRTSYFSRMNLQDELLDTFRDIPDFPSEGILFKDITPLLKDATLSGKALDALCASAQTQNLDAIIGIESRGFLFGLPLALRLGIPFIPIRKKGKLPAETVGLSYDLEYGSAEIEIHKDALPPGARVMVHDDVLATGGTAQAAIDLLRKCGIETVATSFLLELKSLNGRANIEQKPNQIVTLAAC